VKIPLPFSFLLNGSGISGCHVIVDVGSSSKHEVVALVQCVAVAGPRASA